MINLFNLMPLSLLDGGKRINRLLFSRSPRFEAGFTVLSSAVLALIAFCLHSGLLCAVAVQSVLSARSSHRVAKAARALKARAQFPETLSAASGEFLRQLFEEVYQRADRS